MKEWNDIIRIECSIEGVASKSVSTLALISVRARNENDRTRAHTLLILTLAHTHEQCRLFCHSLWSFPFNTIFLHLTKNHSKIKKDMRHTRMKKKTDKTEQVVCECVQCACTATTSMMATAPSYQWGFFNQRFLFHPYFSSFLFILQLRLLVRQLDDHDDDDNEKNVTPHIEWLGYFIFLLFIDFALWCFHNGRCFDSSSQRGRDRSNWFQWSVYSADLKSSLPLRRFFVCVCHSSFFF